MNVDKEDYEAPVVGKDQTISDVIHEIQILKRLAMSGSTNVNQIFEARSVHTQIWVVTEYCPGGSVRTLVRSPYFPKPISLLANGSIREGITLPENVTIEFDVPWRLYNEYSHMFPPVSNDVSATR